MHVQSHATQPQHQKKQVIFSQFSIQKSSCGALQLILLDDVLVLDLF